MLRPQGLLPDRQRPLVERLGLGVLALGAVELCQVVERGRQARVFGPKRFRGLQRGLGLRHCLGVIALPVRRQSGADMAVPFPLLGGGLRRFVFNPSEGISGDSQSLLGGLAVPVGGLGSVLGNAPASLMHQTEFELGLGIALLGGLAELFERRRVVAHENGSAPSIVGLVERLGLGRRDRRTKGQHDENGCRQHARAHGSLQQPSGLV